MTNQSTTILVPFHGDQIICIDTPDGMFVAIRPISDRLGLSYPAQWRKLKGNEKRWGGCLMAIPSGGGEQESYCLPLTKLAAWLFSVNANKVKPELREAVERYQDEAAEVLDHHFRLKDAEKDVEITHLSEQLACCHEFLMISNPKWNQIRFLTNRHTSLPTIGRRVCMTMTRIEEEKEMMRDCGIMPMYGVKGTGSVDLNERIRILELRNGGLKNQLDTQNGQQSELALGIDDGLEG